MPCPRVTPRPLFLLPNGTGLSTHVCARPLAAVYPTHVITRNSHASAIQSFLAAEGVPVASVRVVRKGESKASAMASILPSLADTGGSRALFVDDNVHECCDARVAALPGLFRVLFRRGAVV